MHKNIMSWKMPIKLQPKSKIIVQNKTALANTLCLHAFVLAFQIFLCTAECIDIEHSQFVLRSLLNHSHYIQVFFP